MPTPSDHLALHWLVPHGGSLDTVQVRTTPESLPAPRPSRARVVLLTAAWSGAGQVVAIVGQLALVPLFLRAWGTISYGEWLSLTAAVAYLSLLDGGMQHHVGNRLTESWVKGDWRTFDRELASAVTLYLVSTGAVVLATAALMLATRTWNWQSPLQDDVAALLALLGVQVSLTLWFGLVVAMYRVMGRADRAQFVTVLARLVLMAGTALLLALRCGPISVAAFQGAHAAVFVVLIAFDVCRTDARFVPRFSQASVASAKGLIGPSLHFLNVNVSQALSVQGTLLAARVALGPSAVTTWATTRTLANVLRQAATLIPTAAWPEFTRLAAAEQWPAMARAHRILAKTSTFAVIMAAATLATEGGWIYAWWTGGNAPFVQPLLLVFLVDLVLSAPWLASSYVLASVSKVRGISLAYLVAGGVSVAGAYICFTKLGITAAAVAILSTNLLFFSWTVPTWVGRILAESPAQYARDVYVPALLTSGAAFGVALLVAGVMPDGWGRLAVTAACVSATSAGCGAVWLRSELGTISRLLGKAAAGPT